MSETQTLLMQLLDEVMAIREALGRADGSSSVQLSTSARGTDVTVKCYAGSPVVQAGDAALDEYVRVMTEVKERLMANFEAEATRRGK